MSKRRKVVISILAALGVLAIGAVAVVALVRSTIDDSRDQMYDGRLVDADYWTQEPAILSAGLGFDGTISAPSDDEQASVNAGAAWDSALKCAKEGGPTDGDRSSLALASGVTMSTLVENDTQIEYVDGLPVVFSWPIRTDTLRPSQFRFTLNTGEQPQVNVITMTPNFELNERNTVVMFADLGNRGLPGEPDAKYPVKLEIVPASDGTELMLAGPAGDVSATGLTYETDNTPYASGPTLVGAKLNRIDDVPQGEGPVGTFGNGTMPNDERTLFGDQGDFRLRMLTSGGFSPDGVRGVLPTDFETFFRIHATGTDGNDVVIDTVGVPVEVAGGTLEVIGISDLGLREDADGQVFYDDCYAEDRDNYLDIIIVGSDAAARSITDLEIPSVEGGYAALFNPGGPGQTPTPGIRYTAPGPARMQPVTIAIDDPMRVTRN